jgi:hypothetical protein
MTILPFLLLIAAAEPIAPPTFTAARAEGGNVSGPLRSIETDWTIRLGGSPPTHVAGPDLLSLRRTDARLPAFPTDAQVMFTNGDRLAGTVATIARERVAFIPGFGGPVLSLPLSAISVLWFADPASETDSALVRRRLLNASRRRDEVWLRNGDLVAGALTAVDKDDVHLEVERKGVAVERNKVAYIALSTELARTLRPKGVYARLTLADGSRIGVTVPRIDGTSLAVRTLFDAALTVPLTDVVALDLHQGKAVYLAEVKPRSYKHVPWSAGLTWPYVANGSVSGHDLHLGGSFYDQGLGMHGTSSITYPLDGAYRRFEALVGLDDREGQNGRVRVRVLVDGKPSDLGWDRDLTIDDGAKPLRVNVTGANELTLIVERGRSGWWDQQGHVNWVDARLVK